MNKSILACLLGCSCAVFMASCRSTINSSQIKDAAASHDSLVLNKSVYHNSTLQFTQHTGASLMQNYLAMNISYPPIKDLRQQLESRLPYALKNRGEAHITTVTPNEYANALNKYLQIDQINDIANAAQIQSLQISAVCVGHGTATLGGALEHTWFVVVKSPDLIALRQQIQSQFATQGGDPAEFQPETFYSHITLGYTKRDLHEEDGVIKDESSCVYPLTFTN